MAAYNVRARFDANRVLEVEASSLIAASAPQPTLLVDVRFGWEYERDRIGDSALLPLSELRSEAGVEQLRALMAQVQRETGQQPEVVLYCERGVRSARAQQYLAEVSIETSSLAGGIRAWRQEVSAERDAEVLTANRLF
ncbi:rhodanese-like domain-containing protein [Synechococcus sp. PCC 7336]|uniref:rhodanese-like domain-containing protein n=1 Tax=Synechococcus sp. PCC 7336 TaxID=195250 RepID=UPI00034D5C37|nr:rhodanese-like domain-containing protein [Synechococcus sp. PCC 7336]